MKSYSGVLQELCKAPSSRLQTELKTVVKSVVDEEDRSRSFMLFGLQEETKEDDGGKVCDVLYQRRQYPRSPTLVRGPVCVLQTNWSADQFAFHQLVRL